MVNLTQDRGLDRGQTSRKDAVKNGLRHFPDFPKEGINFVDVMPILMNPKLLDYLVGELVEAATAFSRNSDAIAGMEARGFLFGPLVARELKLPFVCVRKPGKLPGPVLSESYEKEYGLDTVEMQADAVKAGSSVLILDDLIATGGTAIATKRLIEKAGASCSGALFISQIAGLDGRRLLEKENVDVKLIFDQI